VKNIVANAYQAMEGRDPAKLSIRTCRNTDSPKHGESFCVEIEDTGSGMEKEVLQEIFDPAFSGREGGNGLGLWMVETSLLRMDGNIKVESTVGKGTIFTIELPIRETNL
jgi:signal transduction histidine kinase